MPVVWRAAVQRERYFILLVRLGCEVGAKPAIFDMGVQSFLIIQLLGFDMS